MPAFAGIQLHTGAGFPFPSTAAISGFPEIGSVFPVEFAGLFPAPSFPFFSSGLLSSGVPLIRDSRFQINEFVDFFLRAFHPIKMSWFEKQRTFQKMRFGKRIRLRRNFSVIVKINRMPRKKCQNLLRTAIWSQPEITNCDLESAGDQRDCRENPSEQRQENVFRPDPASRSATVRRKTAADGRSAVLPAVT